MQCLPASVKLLINIETKWNYDTGDYTIRPWKGPNSVSHEEHREILQALDRAMAMYPAPTKKWLGGRISVLLAHYFLASTDETLNTGIAMDWLEALRDLPQDLVRRACEHWRDNRPDAKPKPGDIRLLARGFGGRDLIALERLRALAQLPIGEGEGNARKLPTDVIKRF